MIGSKAENEATDERQKERMQNALLLAGILTMTAGCRESPPPFSPYNVSHQETLMSLFHFSQADLEANRKGEILPHQRYPIRWTVIFLIVFISVGVMSVYTLIQMTMTEKEGRVAYAIGGILFAFFCVFLIYMLINHVRCHYETQVCVSEDKVLSIQQKGIREPHHYLITDNHWYETNINDFEAAKILKRGQRYRIYYPCGVKWGEKNWLLSLEPIEEKVFHEFNK